MARAIQVADRRLNSEGAGQEAQTRSWLLLGSLLLLLGISVGLRPVEIREADVFWHLATGRWMLDQSAIPYRDPFSHTAADLPWVNHEWLFQLVLRVIQAAGGLTGLYAMKVVFYTAALALPAWMAWRRKIGPEAVVVAAGMSLFMGFPYSEYRPLMVSLLLLGAAAEGARRASAGDRNALYWLPLLFALWSNLHATFPLGLLAVGCWATLPETRAGGFLASRKRMLLLLAICALATLLNPYGPGVWTVPAKVAGSRLFMSANEEWRPPDLSPEYWPFYLSLPLLIWSGYAQRRSFRGEWLLAAILAAASFKSRRIIPFYAIPALPVLASALQVAAAALPGGAGSHARKLAIAAALLFAAGTFWAWKITSPQAISISLGDGLSFPNGAFPDACARTLKEAAPGGKLFNDYNHGGFLHYSVGPAWKVFIDGRNDLYGEQLTYLYNGLALGQGRWREVLDGRGVDAALISYMICSQRPNLALALADDPEWALVDVDDAGMLFLRRNSYPASWIAQHEYRIFKPMLLYEEQAPLHRERGMFPAFVADLRRRVKAGRSRIVEQTLVQALLEMGSREEALQFLSRTEEFYGADPMTLELRSRLSSLAVSSPRR